ncbi:MAG TPA: glycosyltransferase, partial [Candidatus Bathyarchaeia archaeon]|nr:glycosyltransferase [Candidatus Bathyarchaeia archaeon]
MRILIDCRFWGTKHTGLGRYTENLVTNLLKIDKKNEYILLSSSKNNIIIEQYGNITVLPVNAAYYSLKEQLVLPKLIHKLKPDLIHFPHFNVPILTNFPFVVTIHDLIKHHSRGRETTTHQALFYWTKFL